MIAGTSVCLSVLRRKWITRFHRFPPSNLAANARRTRGELVCDTEADAANASSTLPRSGFLRFENRTRAAAGIPATISQRGTGLKRGSQSRLTRARFSSAACKWERNVPLETKRRRDESEIQPGIKHAFHNAAHSNVSGIFHLDIIFSPWPERVLSGHLLFVCSPGASSFPTLRSRRYRDPRAFVIFASNEHNWNPSGPCAPCSRETLHQGRGESLRGGWPVFWNKLNYARYHLPGRPGEIYEDEDAAGSPRVATGELRATLHELPNIAPR